MIILVVIVLAWVAVLGPSLLRRRNRSIGSIHHFHHSLEVLEHSGPAPIVSPAYRLHAVDQSGSLVRVEPGSNGDVVPKLTVVGAKDLPRPALAFLGGDPVDQVDEEAYQYDEFEERVTDSHREAYSRQVTLQRRRDTLLTLIGLVVSTLIIGLIPGASLAWIVSAVTAVILVAYVAMLVNLRRRAEERERKLRYLAPREAAAGDVAYEGHAPRHDLPVYTSGRYGHPSNQSAVSH